VDRTAEVLRGLIQLTAKALMRTTTLEVTHAVAM